MRFRSVWSQLHTIILTLVLASGAHTYGAPSSSQSSSLTCPPQHHCHCRVDRRSPEEKWEVDPDDFIHEVIHSGIVGLRGGRLPLTPPALAKRLAVPEGLVWEYARNFGRSIRNGQQEVIGIEVVKLLNSAGSPLPRGNPAAKGTATFFFYVFEPTLVALKELVNKDRYLAFMRTYKSNYLADPRQFREDVFKEDEGEGDE